MEDYYLAFDTETGGLDENVEDLLTAYFAIITYDYKIVDELDLKLKPDGGRLPIANAGALKVNGINIQEHMSDPATIAYSEANKLLVEFLQKHRKPGRWSNITPLAHNAPFDLRWTQKHIIPFAQWDKLCSYAVADTKGDGDALKRWGFLPASVGSLSSYVEYFGIPKRNAHNAREDTLMMIDVAKAMEAFMRSKKEGGSSQDLITLLEAE